MVQPRPRWEFGWNPIRFPLPLSDTIGAAARRVMGSVWNAPPPEPWFDLGHCERQAIGGDELLCWTVGYGLRPEWEPQLDPGRAAPNPRLRVSEFRWLRFEAAFGMLEHPLQQRALLRLHQELRATG